MFSVMQQEIGGQDRFISDPTAYHYAADAKGRRIAPHTGKVSTAFGPFGILESTAADPGYGVAPLANKTIEEQVRFASQYLAARSKKGGLQAGLAGYGEGEKYAAQVSKRIGGKPAAATVPMQEPVQEPMVAAAPVVEAPVQVAQVTQEQAPVLAQVPQMQGPDAWQQFLLASQQAQAPQPADMDYGAPTRTLALTAGMPDFMGAIGAAGSGSIRPDFRRFNSMKAWA